MTQSRQITSLDSFADSTWKDDPHLDGLDAIVSAIAEGAKQVRRRLQEAALGDVLGTTGDINVQGEVVQRLDVEASDIFADLLSKSGRVAIVGSEEVEEAMIVGSSEDQRYLVLMDPVDGSSNIDVGVSVGSIFGIWKRAMDEAVTSDTLLRPGRDQVAAAYVLYGSSTVMVVATSGRVDGFTLDVERGDFALTHPQMKAPEAPQYYSFNEGNFSKLDSPNQKAVEALRDRLSLRYVGSLVPDFHRNMVKGGIYLYPRDSERPGGKLRLMYEANPLGFIAEQAGGSASSDTGRILDIEPTHLHQRTSLFVGDKAEVEGTVTRINEGK